MVAVGGGAKNEYSSQILKVRPLPKQDGFLSVFLPQYLGAFELKRNGLLLLLVNQQIREHLTTHQALSQELGMQ